MVVLICSDTKKQYEVSEFILETTGETDVDTVTMVTVFKAI